MGSRNTVKWRKPIILGGITYLVIAASIFLRAELERYAIVPVSRDEWPGVVFSISENAKAKSFAILPKRVYLDKGKGAYFIEYSFSDESLRFLIEQLDLVEAEPKTMKNVAAHRWPAKILREFSISVDGSQMFLSKSIVGDIEGDFVCLLNPPQRIVLRYVYDN